LSVANWLNAAEQETKVITMNAADASSDKIDAAIAAQLKALEEASSKEKITAHLVTESTGYRLWTSVDNLDSSWQQSLDEAHAVFANALENAPSLDIVLLNDATELGRVDKSLLNEGALILPLDIIEKKSVSKRATTQAVVAHETCHKWLINLANARGIEKPESTIPVPSYGHGGLPDWFDEAIAVICETGEVAASRFTNEFTPIPLHAFLTMDHPLYAQIKQKIMAATQKNSEFNVLKVKGVGDNSIDFYVQAAWFTRFLKSTIGKDALRQILSEFATGNAIDSFLLKSLDEEQLSAVNTRFVEFIDAQQAEIVSR
jgi:hypothetical protein